MHTKRLWLLAAMVMAALVLAGCGSSGAGPGDEDDGPLLSGRTAERAMVLANYKAWRATKTYMFDALRAAQPIIEELLAKIPLPLRQVDLVSDLGLYRKAAVRDGNIITIAYFSDAGATQPAGDIKVLLPQAALTGSPLQAFPALCTLKINVTGGVLPARGDVSLSLRSLKGASQINGTVMLSPQGDVISVDYDFALSDTQVLSGKYAVYTHQTETKYPALSGKVPANLTSPVTILPYRWNGASDASFATSAYRLTLNTRVDTTVVGTIGAGGALGITYADGSTETIAQPLAAPLAGVPGR